MPLDLSKFADLPQIDQKDAATPAEDIVKRYPGQLKGKTVLVTGVSPGGIGAATILALATGEPKTLILAGRSLDKVNKTAEDVKKINSSVQVRTLQLDLADLNQVTKAAKSLSDIPVIDVVINNAGIMAHPFSLSVDGFESQFASNHLGHFQLTKVLLPQLQASSTGGTVVNLTSAGHRLGEVHFDDFNYSNGATYDKWDAYGQSKSANILHALALKKKGLVKRAFAVHPGNVRSNLLVEEARPDIEAAFGPSENLPKSISQGASTSVWAALNPNLLDFNYLEDCQISKAKEHATNPEFADRLWQASEEIVASKVKA